MLAEGVQAALLECEQNGSGAVQECESVCTDWYSAGFFELAVLPLIPYLTWVVLYYVKLFIVSEDKIREQHYDTVYHYMMS